MRSKRTLPLVARTRVTADVGALKRHLDSLIATPPPVPETYDFKLSNASGKDFIEDYSGHFPSYYRFPLQTLRTEVRESLHLYPRDVSTYTPLERMRGMKDKNSAHYHPLFDEANYDEPTSCLSGDISDLFQRLPDRPFRSAFVNLQPGRDISPHIDTDPSLILRFHIPITTNEECCLGFITGNTMSEFHLPADGHIYFINAGYPHFAFNKGSSARWHIRFHTNTDHLLSELVPLEPVKTYDRPHKEGAP